MKNSEIALIVLVVIAVFFWTVQAIAGGSMISDIQSIALAVGVIGVAWAFAWLLKGRI